MFFAASILPAVAGAARMSYSRFTLSNIAGGALWVISRFPRDVKLRVRRRVTELSENPYLGFKEVGALEAFSPTERL